MKNFKIVMFGIALSASMLCFASNQQESEWVPFTKFDGTPGECLRQDYKQTVVIQAALKRAYDQAMMNRITATQQHPQVSGSTISQLMYVIESGSDSDEEAVVDYGPSETVTDNVKRAQLKADMDFALELQEKDKAEWLTKQAKFRADRQANIDAIRLATLKGREAAAISRHLCSSHTSQQKYEEYIPNHAVPTTNPAQDVFIRYEDEDRNEITTGLHSAADGIGHNQISSSRLCSRSRHDNTEDDGSRYNYYNPNQVEFFSGSNPNLS